MSRLLIANAQVLQVSPTGSSVTILEEQDVLVNGQRIEAVQPTGAVDPSHFDTVIDAHGMLVAPGLINCHAHVPMVLWRGLAEDASIDRWFNDLMWPLENNLQPEDVYWGMLLGLIEQIESGVTSVADHYFHMAHAARAVEQIGARALLGYAMFGSQGLNMIEETASFAQDFQGAAHGRIRTIMAPHAPYTCNDDFLRATAQIAQKLGVGIHIHVSETPQQTIASYRKRGITPLQVLQQTGVLDVPTILAHVCGATPADIRLLEQYDTGIAHAAKTYLKLGETTAPVIEFRAAGIPVGLASDGVVSNSTLNLWETLRLMALTQKARTGMGETLPIAETLAIATHGSAKVYGQPNELGAIRPGYLADLVLIDLSGTHHQPLYNVGASLVYNLQSADVRTVIIDGQVVMRDRQLLTINKAEVIAQVRSRMDRLSYLDPAKRIQTYDN
ncbi:MAG: amidohydrolase [Chloroflexi bacterium]|uniref:amidohydrolase n=1 Tax=Candidatus Flexifilum breve TaxID=3140694 RepID=UPI003135F752|nr:amidohydrolase [Chloroflexota bacterium]